jgi:hypothetical protein
VQQLLHSGGGSDDAALVAQEAQLRGGRGGGDWRAARAPASQRIGWCEWRRLVAVVVVVVRVATTRTKGMRARACMSVKK